MAEGTTPPGGDVVAALRDRVVATGYLAPLDVDDAPSAAWLLSAIATNATDLADDLLRAFGGAVLARHTDLVPPGCGPCDSAWVQSLFPFSGIGESRAPCTRDVSAPGWWPPDGPASLTDRQVVVLIQTGSLDALKRAHADNRLVPPSICGWVIEALCALRPDIADWLLEQFGPAVVPSDNGHCVAALLWPRNNAHVAKAMDWLRAAQERGWRRATAH